MSGNQSNQNSNQSNTNQSYVEMHRISWIGNDGEYYSLFVAGADPAIVHKAVVRLAYTIATEDGVSVADDLLLSSDPDLDAIPF